MGDFAHRVHTSGLRPFVLAVTAAVLLAGTSAAADDPAATADRCGFASCGLPSDPAACAPLPLPSELMAKDPQHGLDEYELLVGRFFYNLCHRSLGWKRDKRVRDTGPFTAAFTTAEGWQGEANGVHPAVVMYYSPEVIDWLEANRGETTVADPPPIPDGAIIVKEMYEGAASSYAGQCVECLAPDDQGLTFMVRDAAGSHDGWFWGYFGYANGPVQLDQPPAPGNPLPSMGFAPYCLNCHASAESMSTFATLENIAGMPGEPLDYLSQSGFYEDDEVPSHHRTVELASDAVTRLGEPLKAYAPEFVATFKLGATTPPTWDDVPGMPPVTYDHVWARGEKAEHFLTSDQCVGCHDAGSTGLQYDMTAPAPASLGRDQLVNLSPFGEWQASPMGLAGRDPVFFSMLESEAAFHPEYAVTAQTICLQCHGVLGQRQSMLDNDCDFEGHPYLRATLEQANLASAWDPAARYGALSRDGISCQACHRYTMDRDVCAEIGLSKDLCDQLQRTAPPDPAQNECIEAQRAFEVPTLHGFGKTFLGNYPVTAPDRLLGPFEDPQQKPMDHAMGLLPEASELMTQSEVCGSCHTIYLPVFDDQGTCVKRTYEQTTYPEWVFSAFRSEGFHTEPGSDPQTCQQCHMKTERDGEPLVSKIASIQEKTDFPEFPYTLPGSEIDLDARADFARHTLVGLNVFLVEMAQQFPDVLGIRTTDPMLVSFGVAPLLFGEQQMVDQAQEDTVTITVPSVERTADGGVEATVALESKVGHKFPSGVGFRRAFLEVAVVDERGRELWASGKTDGAGRLVDGDGKPLPGELWWTEDCSRRLPDTSVDVPPERRAYQPHYQVIERRDQAQIYQEIVRTPLPGETGSCPNPPPKLGRPFDRPRLEAPGMFTNSFLSIGGHVKDNRILPKGWDPSPALARTIGDEGLAEDVLPRGVGDDPHYRKGAGGGDSLVYRIPGADLAGVPAAVRVRLFYQATPPYFLQDRFCANPEGQDTARLYFLAGHLNLDGTPAEGWKLQVGDTTCTAVGGGDSGAC